MLKWETYPLQLKQGLDCVSVALQRIKGRFKVHERMQNVTLHTCATNREFDEWVSLIDVGGHGGPNRQRQTAVALRAVATIPRYRQCCAGYACMVVSRAHRLETPGCCLASPNDLSRSAGLAAQRSPMNGPRTPTRSRKPGKTSFRI